MASSLEVMAQLHRAIQQQYVQHSRVSQHCYLSAISIADALINQEGKSPEIREYRVIGGKPRDGQTFKVKGYENMRGYVHHKVCVCDGQVYEPLLGQVIPEKEYPQKLAGMGLDWKIDTSSQELQKGFSL